MTIRSETKLGRYEIRSKIGEGGMGEVYLAEDTKLHRRVAIKFLPLDSAANDRANRRLLREAQAAAKLDHPNICAVHEVSEEDGRSFIVMPYIEGETLDVRMKRKSFDISESLTIATQVADALVEAHAHGIIHRDIKPSNIIVTPRGQAKVMDFGLAKLSEPISAAGGQIDSEASTQAYLTTPGTVVGTLPYMSPEQVHGQTLDARSDVFSFGVVLYEMLTGAHPFAAQTPAGTISAILTKEPAPLMQCLASCPEELQRIVRKCLEKDRDRRYQTMRDVAIDLENCQREFQITQASTSQRSTKSDAVPAHTSEATGPRLFRSRRALVSSAAVLTLLASVALVYLFVVRRNATTARSPEIKSLAVLPLNNLSGDPSQEYFADGMTEALISNLSQIKALRVISRQSVMRYKESRESLPEIARQLGGVDAVIQGSVQRAGGRVRVTVQLIPAMTDATVWSRSYERELSDLLKLESDVAQAIAGEVRAQLTSAEQKRLTSAKAINPQAHDAYLLGRYHLNKLNEEDLRQAIENFERAIQLAPDYATAWAGLSDAWRERGIWGQKTFKEVEAPSRDAALKALELDAGIAEAHVSLSYIKQLYDWDWTGAEQEVERALEIDPGSLDAHRTYAILLMAIGRHSEAISEAQRAEQLDPLSSDIQSTFGRILYRARKYEEAIPHFKRALELDPGNYSAYIRLGDVYAKLSRYDEAIAVFEKAAQLRSDGMDAARLARVYVLMGRQQEARQLISRTKARAFDTAAFYAALGDQDEAFRILEKAVEERNSLLVYVKEDPSFDNLHSDPRWHELLRRMNYPSE